MLFLWRWIEITIKDLVREAECSFCQQAKDGCVLEFEDQKRAETVHCRGCIKKMPQIKVLMSGKKPETKPAGNGAPAAAAVLPK